MRLPSASSWLQGPAAGLAGSRRGLAGGIGRAGVAQASARHSQSEQEQLLGRREPPYSSLEELQTQLDLPAMGKGSRNHHQSVLPQDQGVLLLLGPEGPGLRTEALGLGAVKNLNVLKCQKVHATFQVRRGCDRCAT